MSFVVLGDDLVKFIEIKTLVVVCLVIYKC